MTLAVKLIALPDSKMITPIVHVRLESLIQRHRLFYILVLFINTFESKCPLGCPCDQYDCNLPEKKAILVLHTNQIDANHTYPPVLIQPGGKLNRQLWAACSEFQIVLIQVI